MISPKLWRMQHLSKTNVRENQEKLIIYKSHGKYVGNLEFTSQIIISSDFVISQVTRSHNKG